MPGRDAVLWGAPTEPEDAPRRSILHCVRMLAPFKEAQPTPGGNADIAEGQRQFYAFIKGMYGEMYSDPAFFLIPENEYDEYMRTAPKKPNAKGGHPKADRKERNLRNKFQQAIRFYAAYLFELGKRAKSLENGVMTLEEKDWEKARQAMEWTHLRGENKPRYERLRAIGLDERKEPGLVYVTSRDFPKMFYGLKALCDAPDNPYRYGNYLRLDFAGALRGKPTAEDAFKVLDPQLAACARTLHGAVTGRGGKEKIKPLREITSGSRWKVEYVQGGRNIAAFYAGPEELTFCLYFGTHKRISAMSEKLWQQEPLLGAWLDSKFPEKLCECPNNCEVTLGDGPRKICGLSCRAEIDNPSPEDVGNSLAVIALLELLED